MAKIRCTGPCGALKTGAAFARGKKLCKKCSKKPVEDPAKAARDRDARISSDFTPLNLGDVDIDYLDDEYATGLANDSSPGAGKVSAAAAREKRQEFNEQMGEFAQDLRDAASTAHRRRGSVVSGVPEKHAGYMRLLAEQERRFGNRRWSRSIALAEAHEQMTREQMMYVAETYFKDKIEPVGYAAKPPRLKPMKRTVSLVLSDIHLGSELDSLDEPMTYRAFEEARRLEHVLREFCDYKPQYREDTTANLLLLGDIIEGNLMHDYRAGSPLTEQKAIFWEYFSRFVAHVSSRYPRVNVICQPGNHGRDKLRHPGRATSSKWDGVEFGLYYALKMMCSGLKNVEWSIPFRAVSIIDVHGSKIGATHADTELKLGDPDTKSKENAATLANINSLKIYGEVFDGWVFGHYHKGRYVARTPRQIWNAALVPPNGHARTSGYIGEQTGQFLFESVEGHPIGDVRFLEVGLSQDHDESLGRIIQPFRFSLKDA